MATLQAIELVKHMSDVRLCVGRCRMEGTQFGACWHPRARALVVMLAPSPTLAACPPSACPAAKHGAPVAPRRTLGDPFGQEPARRVSGQGCPDGARSAGNRGGACAWTCPRCTSSPSATAACPLRSDPLGQEEELQWVRPWSEEERRIFADKFLQYSKDFAKIALYLPARSRGVLTSAASAPALMAIAAQPVHPAPPARGGTGKRRARRPAAAVKPPYADLGACESQRQSPAAHACLARSLGAHALAVQATRWHGARASRWGLRLWTRTARRAWTTRRAAATPPGCRLPALLGARAAHPTPPATTASARLSGAWLTAAAW